MARLGDTIMGDLDADVYSNTQRNTRTQVHREKQYFPSLSFGPPSMSFSLSPLLPIIFCMHIYQFLAIYSLLFLHSYLPYSLTVLPLLQFNISSLRFCLFLILHLRFYLTVLSPSLFKTTFPLIPPLCPGLLTHAVEHFFH